MKTSFFIDIHCHPSIKAYARSFKGQAGQQSSKPTDRSSIWNRDFPSLFDKLKNYAIGLTNFIQSDAKSLLEGRVCVVCLSFYPQEKGFFDNKLGTGELSDTIVKLVGEFGQERVDHLQAMNSYWEDLKTEMNFLKQQEGKLFTIDKKKVSYEIARSYVQIEAADVKEELGETKILFVPTIEGAHIFDQVMDYREPWDKYPGGIPDEVLQTVLRRVSQLREEHEGMIRPFFMTFAHHFWNGLCGHERSLTGIVKLIVDQENGLGQGFTKAGKSVITALLQKQTNAEGKKVPPILIDIKHMSYQSRQEYFAILDELGDMSIPVIASHAGVTGLSGLTGTADTPAAREGLYLAEPINFYDTEILKIESTMGLFGIQLDERRIGSKQALRAARGNVNRRDILYAWAKLVWNQVRHIAELLDMNGRYAWGVQCLGSDFDGIIDPINGYWTAKEIDHLDDFLLMHAYNYIAGVSVPCPLQQERNKSIKAEEIVERVLTGNALNFFAKHF